MTAIASRPQASATVGADDIPFARLCRVEWSKAIDTRAARWLIGLTALATVAIVLAPTLAKNSIDQTYRNYLEFPADAMTTLLPIVVILTLTSEWTQRTVLATFTQEPRRGRVLAAKLIAALVLGLLSAAFVAAVTAATVWLVTAGGRSVDDDVAAAQVVGFVVFVLLNMLMAAAFGALLQNTAAAIVLIFVLPIALNLIAQGVPVIRRWFDPASVFDTVLDGAWRANAGPIVVVTAIWVLLPLAAGVVRTLRREIK
jgi:ABC-2 type transport system permease protein